MIKNQRIIILIILTTLLTGVFFYVIFKVNNNSISENKLVNSAEELKKDDISPDLINTQDFSVKYPNNWYINYHEYEEGYESLVISSVSNQDLDKENKSKIEVTSKQNGDHKNIDNEISRNSLVDYLYEVQKEYQINNSGVLDSINKIYFKGYPAVRYNITINIQGVEFSKTDSIYIFKDGKSYLIRFTSYGSSVQKLSDTITEHSKVFELFLNGFEFK